MNQPLSGYRVLDLSILLPGPYCSMMMADLGAEVIKVEPPKTGDYIRETNPVAYQTLNRNKKSLTLNLKQAKGREVFYRLAEGADVILEGFRPGVTARLGIDYEKIRPVNPKIIYCSISGYGQTGPYRDRVGHDINYLGVAGVMSLSGEPGGEPVINNGVAVVDLCSSMFAFGGILVSLMQRAQTGVGQYIDVSMTDCILSWMTSEASRYLIGGWVPQRGERRRGEYGVFPTQDGKFITLGVYEDKFWTALCNSLGLEDALKDPRFSTIHERLKNREAIALLLKDAFRSRTQEEWIKLLSPLDVPCGPLHTLDQVFSDPQVQARNMLAEVMTPSGKLRYVGFPLKFSGMTAEIRHPAPKLGEQNQDILRSLNYSEEAISDLRREGVI
jgi:crotonobetainyl-CoA:carnitine CoA-transferase CaiB-like acyl-CoA transferase